MRVDSSLCSLLHQYVFSRSLSFATIPIPITTIGMGMALPNKLVMQTEGEGEKYFHYTKSLAESVSIDRG